MCIGLPLQGHLKHLFGQQGTNVEADLFQFREFGSPGEAVGPIELIDQVFGDAFQVRA